MTRRGVRLIVILLVASAASAQDAGPRFRFERPVQPAAAGPNRLAVDVPLLAGSRLTDLRLFDAEGREVAYLLVDPPAAAPSWTIGALLPVAATEKTSGFEIDLVEALPIDRVRIGGIRAPFLKRALLEGSGDREHWTVLAAEGTLFDLPAEGLTNLELLFTPGVYRYLRVTWDDTNSGHVGPPRRASARRLPEPVVARPPLTASIPFERRPSEPGRSRFRLQLPAPRLPITQITLDVEGDHLMRRATISEPRFDGRQVQPAIVGDATLKRISRDGLHADQLTIPIAGTTESALELVVDDGNNPPLALRSITAVFAPQPTIYFESDGRALMARYGDPTLASPRYDLEAARESLRMDRAASAEWGVAAPAALEVTAAPAPPMPLTGTTLDAAAFSYSRGLPPGVPGLVAVGLDAAVLANSAGVRGEFRDVRVLDSAGRQIPYVVERLDEPLTLPVVLQRVPEPPLEVRSAGRVAQSWYRVELPQAALPDARLTLQTPARVFQRVVTLTRVSSPAGARREPLRRAFRPGSGQALRPGSGPASSSTPWIHALADEPAPSLTLTIPDGDTRELWLSVAEGDNTPLTLERATLLLPSYRIRFFRPDGSTLRLVYGRADLDAPQYDLALLAPQVLGAPAAELTVGAEQGIAQPIDQPPPLVRPVVFWAAMGLATLVLLGIIVRLVRTERAEPSA